MRRPLALLILVFPLGAQQRALSTADYTRAESMMPYKTAPLVLHGTVRPAWIAGDRFWYRNTTAQGPEFILVDPADGTRKPAFDHARLAAALSSAAGSTYQATNLPFQSIDLADNAASVSVNIGARRWDCDLNAYSCKAGKPAGRNRNDTVSPDKKQSAFIRDYNLWVRETATGKETQLTTDGVKDFGYATDNAGWTHSDRPIVVWSPDSKKIATFQQDQRGVGEMYLVDTRVGHPNLQAWKYPLPGDSVVTMIQPRDRRSLTRARSSASRCRPEQHRSSLCDDIACRGGEWADVQWSPEQRASGVGLHVARSQAGDLPRGGGRNRRGARCLWRERADVLRIRQRTRQLALPARLQRGHLVLGKEQLGAFVSVRSRHGQAEEPDHHRRLERDPVAASR